MNCTDGTAKNQAVLTCSGPGNWCACPEIPLSSVPAVNVACVPQRSPLRYPGGKTWLIPHIRKWLTDQQQKPRMLIEPFAGGAIVTLTAIMEGLVDTALMAELDRDVAAFWHATLRHNRELCAKISDFEPESARVTELLKQTPDSVLERGFRTLVLNRTRRGGILAAGASLTRHGENGKGLASRWYAQTLIKRIRAIDQVSHHLQFCEGDGTRLLEALLKTAPQGTVCFIDPPYTAGGKRAGSRLYTHHSLDHARLFRVLRDSSADFLMTYDLSAEVLALVRKYRFSAVQVLMKNAHHARLPELVITPQPVFAS